MKMMMLAIIGGVGMATYSNATVGPQRVDVSLVATQSIMPGEPIFVGFHAVDAAPSASPVAIDLGTDYRAGLTIRIGSAAPLPTPRPSSGSAIDDVRPTRFQPVPM